MKLNFLLCVLRLSRLRFPNAILPNVVFQEIVNAQNPVICVIVVTVDREVYRFAFQHPVNLKDPIPHEPSHVYYSCFSDANGVVSQARHLVATISRSDIVNVSNIGPNAIALGTRSGAVVIAHLPDVTAAATIHHTEFELKDASLVQRLLKFVPAMGGDSEIVSGIVTYFYRGERYLFVIYGDHRLRVWSLQGRRLLLTVNLSRETWDGDPNASAAKGGASAAPVRRTLRFAADANDASKFSLVVFSASEASSEAHFEILTGDIFPTGEVSLQTVGVSYFAESSLVDFQLCNDSIWTLWWVRDSPGAVFQVRHSTLPKSGVTAAELNSWTEAIMEDVDDGMDHLLEFDESLTVDQLDSLFKSALLRAGRFSVKSLQNGLRNYMVSSTAAHQAVWGQQVLPNSIVELASAAVKEVHAAVGSTYLDRPDAVHAEWRTLLRLCISSWQYENRPCGLFVMPRQGLVGLVNADSTSLFIPCDPLEAVYCLTQTIHEDDHAALTGAVRSFRGVGDGSGSLPTLLATMSFAASKLSPSQRRSFEEEVFVSGMDPAIVARNLVAVMTSGWTADAELLNRNGSSDDDSVRMLLDSEPVTVDMSSGTPSGTPYACRSVWRARQLAKFVQQRNLPRSVLTSDKHSFEGDVAKRFFAVKNVVNCLRELLLLLHPRANDMEDVQQGGEGEDNGAGVSMDVVVDDVTGRRKLLLAGDVQALTQRLLTGDLVEMTVIRAATHVIRARLVVLRNLTLLLAFLQSNPSRNNLSLQDSDTLFSLMLPAVSSLLRHYIVLDYLTAELAVDPVKPTSTNSSDRGNGGGGGKYISRNGGTAYHRRDDDGDYEMMDGEENDFYRTSSEQQHTRSKFSTFADIDLTWQPAGAGGAGPAAAAARPDVTAAVPSLLTSSSLKNRSLMDMYIRTVRSALPTLLRTSREAIVGLLPEIHFDDGNAPESLSHAVSSFVTLVDPTTSLPFVVAVPYVLLQQRQYKAVLDYCRLLTRRSLFLQHILGEAYLQLDDGGANNGNSSNGLSNDELALQCFMEAGAGLEDVDVQASDVLVDYIVQSLGSANGDDEESSRDSLNDVPLQYWRFLIPLLERRSKPELAIRASLAALAHVESSIQQQQQQQQNVERENTVVFLWTNVFTNSIKLGMYDQAYLATTSIPSIEHRDDCLKRLVAVMAESQQLATLLEFPFVNMVEQVNVILVDKARRADVTESPNYYQVLYAFYVKRGNYRLAAQAMFDYAERVSVESHPHAFKGVAPLEVYSRSLLAATNALKMVDKQYAWIIIKRKSSSSTGSLATSPKRKFGSTFEINNSSAAAADSSSNDVEVKTLEDLERLYAISQANVKLARRGKAHSSTASQLKLPHVALGHLLDAELFDDAISLCNQLDMDMTQVFEMMTRACLRISAAGSNTAVALREEKTKFLELQQLLDRFDSPTVNYKYRVAVATTILSVDNRIRLPVWLVDGFVRTRSATSSTGGNTSSSLDAMDVDDDRSTAPAPTASVIVDGKAELLRLYLDFDLLEEAASLAVTCFDAARQQLQNGARQVLVPYALVDRLLARLRKLPIATYASDKDSPYIASLRQLKRRLDDSMHLFYQLRQATESKLAEN